MSAPVTPKELATLIPESTATVCDRLEKSVLFSAAIADIFDYMLDGSNLSGEFTYDLCSEDCSTTTTVSTSSTTTTSSTSTTTTSGECVYTGNLIPDMTNNTTPSGECFAEANNVDAWRAFDGDDGTYWQWYNSDSAICRIGYKFNNPFVVSKIRVKLNLSTQNATGGALILQGSNDGVTYTSFGVSWGLNLGLNEFTSLTYLPPLMPPPPPYAYLRVRVDFSPFAGFVAVQFYSLEMFACESSLTTTTSTSTTTSTTAP